MFPAGLEELSFDQERWQLVLEMKLQQFIQFFILIRNKRKLTTKITNSKYLLLDVSVTNKDQFQVKRQMQYKKTFSHGGKWGYQILHFGTKTNETRLVYNSVHLTIKKELFLYKKEKEPGGKEGKDFAWKEYFCLGSKEEQ